MQDWKMKDHRKGGGGEKCTTGIWRTKWQDRKMQDRKMQDKTFSIFSR